MKHAETAKSFYQKVLNDGDLNLLGQLVADSFVTHVPKLKDLPDLDSGVDALHKRLLDLGTIPNVVKRVIEDEDTVLVHSRYLGNRDIAGADILRFDAEGKLAEHWFSRQVVPLDVKDDSMFDGGGVTDISVTQESVAANRKRVEDAFVMFAEGRWELVAEIYAEDYRQHNPHMPDGYERLRNLLRDKGPVVPEVHQIIAGGDLVAVHSSFLVEGLNSDLNSGDKTNAIDIYRFDDNRKIVEHWDVLQMESDRLPNFSTIF